MREKIHENCYFFADAIGPLGPAGLIN